MGKRYGRRLAILGLFALAVGTSMLTGSFAQVGEPPPLCSLADAPLQPEHPLELNHVSSGTLVKSIAMEKEVFVCRERESGRIRQVRDVETFIEVAEALVGNHPANQSVRRVEIGLQVASCTKDFDEGTVLCRGTDQDRTIETLKGQVDLRSCQPHENPDLQPRDPVEMGTVFLGSQWAKTTKVEKEVLLCEGTVVDLYLFTEIVERRQPTNPPSMRPVGPPRFFGIVCIKRIPESSLGTVSTNSCYFFNPNPVPK